MNPELIEAIKHIQIDSGSAEQIANSYINYLYFNSILNLVTGVLVVGLLFCLVIWLLKYLDEY